MAENRPFSTFQCSESLRDYGEQLWPNRSNGFYPPISDDKATRQQRSLHNFGQDELECRRRAGCGQVIEAPAETACKLIGSKLKVDQTRKRN